MGFFSYTRRVTIVLIVLAILVGLVLVMFLADAWTRGRVRRLQRRGIYPLAGEERHADVERLIRMGRRMEAIRVYRDVHGVGLKEAREVVDRLSETIRPWRGGRGPGPGSETPPASGP